MELPNVKAVWEVDDTHDDGEPTLALYFLARDHGVQCIRWRRWNHAVMDLGDAMAAAIRIAKTPVARHPGGEINHAGDGFAD